MMKIKITFKLIIKIFFMIVVLTIVSYGLIHEVSKTDAVKRQDELFIGNLYTSHDTKSNKEVIYFHKAKDGIGVMLAKYKFFIGWKAQLIDKLFYQEGEDWKYIDIENYNGVIPILYGFLNKNSKETIYIKVKNKMDNIDEQANSNSMYDEISWFMILDRPSKNSNAFKIYNMETDELLYRNK